MDAEEYVRDALLHGFWCPKCNRTKIERSSECPHCGGPLWTRAEMYERLESLESGLRAISGFLGLPEDSPIGTVIDRARSVPGESEGQRRAEELKDREILKRDLLREIKERLFMTSPIVHNAFEASKTRHSDGNYDYDDMLAICLALTTYAEAHKKLEDVFIKYMEARPTPLVIHGYKKSDKSFLALKQVSASLRADGEGDAEESKEDE